MNAIIKNYWLKANIIHEYNESNDIESVDCETILIYNLNLNI